MNDKTMFFSRKVKDTETGGKISALDAPILLEYNNGLGFTIDGINPLTSVVANEKVQAPIEENKDFDNEQPPF